MLEFTLLFVFPTVVILYFVKLYSKNNAICEDEKHREKEVGEGFGLGKISSMVS